MRSILKESNKHYIIVSVKGSYINSFVKSLYKTGINIENINYVNDSEINIKILNSDYKRFKKEFKGLDIKKIKDLGLFKIKPFLKSNKIILSAIVFGICLLFFLSNVIVRVDVIHSKKEIRDLVRAELEFHGIRRLSLRKSYERLQEIKSDILDKYPTRLEWIEIEINGMNVTVRIEERIIPTKESEKEACHVVSKKDAIITKIVAYEGETIKRIDNYVRKNDIIISGNITLNEEIKDTVCAKGEVYGEVWYIVEVSIPLEVEEEKLTGRVRNNFMYESSRGKRNIFRSRFDNFNVNNRYLFNILNVKFYFVKEYETEIITRKFTEEEGINRGKEIALKKMKVKLSDNDTILNQKVLKKQVNNSTINLEIFFIVNELISKTIEFVPEIEEEAEVVR